MAEDVGQTQAMGDRIDREDRIELKEDMGAAGIGALCCCLLDSPIGHEQPSGWRMARRRD